MNMNKGRKIPFDYEGPVDIFFVAAAEKLNPFFKRLNFTPNHITTIAVFFKILTLYYFYYNNYKLAILCSLLQYYFDCCDGNYARKYDMVTKFGDLYDHLTDYAYAILLIIMLIRKNFSMQKKIGFVIICILIGSLTFEHVMCTESYLNEKNIKRYSLINKFNRVEKEPTDCLNKTKDFSLGTLNLVIAILIYLMYKY